MQIPGGLTRRAKQSWASLARCLYGRMPMKSEQANNCPGVQPSDFHKASKKYFSSTLLDMHKLSRLNQQQCKNYWQGERKFINQEDGSMRRKRKRHGIQSQLVTERQRQRGKDMSGIKNSSILGSFSSAGFWSAVLEDFTQIEKTKCKWRSRI